MLGAVGKAVVGIGAVAALGFGAWVVGGVGAASESTAAPGASEQPQRHEAIAVTQIYNSDEGCLTFGPLEAVVRYTPADAGVDWVDVGGDGTPDVLHRDGQVAYRSHRDEWVQLPVTESSDAGALAGVSGAAPAALWLATDLHDLRESFREAQTAADEGAESEVRNDVANTRLTWTADEQGQVTSVLAENLASDFPGSLVDRRMALSDASFDDAELATWIDQAASFEDQPVLDALSDLPAGGSCAQLPPAGSAERSCVERLVAESTVGEWLALRGRQGALTFPEC